MILVVFLDLEDNAFVFNISNMLQLFLNPDIIEAGCDEAGRGCLAGPVFAAAVVLPPDFKCELLND